MTTTQINNSLGTVHGIYWGHDVKKLYIKNNTIGGAATDGFVQGSSSNTFIGRQVVGMRGIMVDFMKTVVSRDSVIIRNNTITNLDRLAGTIAAKTSQYAAGSSAILVSNGAKVNQVDSNTITGMDIACGVYNTPVANEAVELIRVDGIPASGSSTINIGANSITNNSRTKYGLITDNTTATSYESFMTGISAANNTSAHSINIYSNIIDNLTSTAASGTAATNIVLIARVQGIRARSTNAAGSNINIFKNNITNISGDILNNAPAFSSTTNVNFTNNFNLIGIDAMDYDVCKIYQNNICNLSTTDVSNTTTTPTFANGVIGIQFGKTTSNLLGSKTLVKEAVYNNFVSGLTAPAMDALLAIQGIHYWGYGAYARIMHNTIALGDPVGGASGRLTSTGSAFGVNGITLDNYYYNTQSRPSIISNNIVSINATPKGSTTNTTISNATTGGIGTCWRNLANTTIKKKPAGIDASSTGNVYFINYDFRNYVYGQGLRYNTTTNKITNCIGYFKNAPLTYNYAANYLVNDTTAPKNFDNKCGLYKSFWGTREKQSAIDLDGSLNIKPIPFTNSGSTCDAKLNIADGVNSYVDSVPAVKAPLLIPNDFYGNPRTNITATAGAFENVVNNVSGLLANNDITFDYTPICDGVCTGSKSITVTITPPSGKTISSATNLKPRLYFRRIQNNSLVTNANSDDNVMPSMANNTATGTEGWRYVEATTVSGNDYNFTLNEAILKSTIATTTKYTIEYFVIAQTSDNSLCSWTSGDLSSACPTSVDLNSIGAAPADDDIDTSMNGNSVSDNFTIYKPSDLTKSLFLLNNNINYAANTDSAIKVCPGDSVSLIAKYYNALLGEMVTSDCATFRFEVADNSVFTTNLQSFSQSDTTFNYAMGSTKKYFRVSIECAGSIMAGTTTTYLSVAVNPLTATLTQPVSDTVCIYTNKTFTATGSNISNTLYFWYDNNGYYNSNTAAGTSTSLPLTNVNETQAGTWTALRGIAATPLANQGVDTSVLTANAGANSASMDEGTGIFFTTEKLVKLNSVVLNDIGSGSTGFRIALKSSDNTLLYQTAGLTVSAGAYSTVSFTNWFISPGDYMLVMIPDSPSTPTGGLAIVNTSMPLNIGGDNVITINGGITGYNPSTANSSNNYFFDLNVTPYCTYDNQNFKLGVVGRPSSDGIDTVAMDTLRMGNNIIMPFSGLPDNFNRMKLKGYTATGKLGILSATWVSDSTYNVVALGITGGIDTIVLRLTDTTKAGCTATDSMVYIVNYIPSCVDEIKLVPYTTSEQGDPSCTNLNGWTYYVDPATNQAICAIYANGNSWNPALVKVDVTDGTHVKSNGTDSTALMHRMLSIIAPGSYPINGGVKVRFYYSPTELVTDVPTSSYPITGWFKQSVGDKSLVLSSYTATSVAAAPLTVSSTGVEAGIDYVQFDNITTFSTFGYYGSTFSPTPLPVELTTFTATKESNHKVSLDWSTASEKNNNHFEVERSQNGVNFESIGRVNTKATNGYSTDKIDYKLIDQNPLNGINYYRLRQVDNDDRMSYSKMITVMFENSNSDHSIVLYPNPTTDFIQCKLSDKSEDIVNITIFDNNNRLLGDKNRFELSNKTIQVSSLPSGIYFIGIKLTSGTTLFSKFVKQ